MRIHIIFLISFLFDSIRATELNITTTATTSELVEPLYSLNTIYNSTDYENFENNVFIVQALNYVLTGSYYTDSTNVTTAFDDNSLASLLEGGLYNILAPILINEGYTG